MTRSNTLTIRTSLIAALLLCAGATLAAAPPPAPKDPKLVVSIPLPASATQTTPAGGKAAVTPGPKNPKEVVSIPLPTSSSASGRPAGAIPACQTLAAGASCSFKDTKGTVSGLCYIEPDKAKVCLPLQRAH
jgi:hypothetical protein